MEAQAGLSQTRAHAGVSASQSLDVNSLAVPRAAKEAIGGIAKLTHDDGRAMTINVEYNQLDPLLRATGHPRGDVADASGFSPYPGESAEVFRICCVQNTKAICKMCPRTAIEY